MNIWQDWKEAFAFATAEWASDFVLVRVTVSLDGAVAGLLVPLDVRCLSSLT